MASTDFNKFPICSTRYGWRLAFSGLLTCLFIFLSYSGPLIHSDTGSYLDFNTLRSPLYPILLKINSRLFGQGHFQGLVFIQLTYGILATVTLTHKMRKILSLRPWIEFPLVLCLLLPYYGPSKFGNSILTEAICYPTFLLAFAYLLEGIIVKNTRSFLYFLGLTILLILTRRQFLFLYPVVTVLLIYLAIFRKKTLRVSLLACTFIASIAVANILERTYQYFTQGSFSTIPFTGMQLVIAPLYISEEKDTHLFDDPLERSLFSEIQLQLKQKKLLFNASNQSPFSDLTIYYQRFYENYNAICWEVLIPSLAKMNITDPKQIDNITIKMAINLIYHHWKSYLTLYLVNIIFNMGGYYYCLLLIILGLLALSEHYRSRDALSLSCLLVLTLSLANYSLVALVEPVMRRYSAYTDSLQVSLLLILITLAFQVGHVRYHR